jgi:Na+-translocating ferredoxin:NAD+ oxidoreductase subunit B
MTPVLTAVAIMAGLGLSLAGILAVAYRYLRVEEDPRLVAVTELLPGTNCGACGSPGCGGFATALVGGEAQPAGCTVADAPTRAGIARLLGVDVGQAVKKVARLRCAGSEGLVGRDAEYRGDRTCRGAVVAGGGGRACTWGCLGLADCERSCTFDAIRMDAGGLPVVTAEACTACGDCVDVCPLDLFVIERMDRQLFVRCASPLTGEAARARCAVACDACGRCAADAPDVVEIIDGLAVVRSDVGATPAATWRCPTGAIVWLDDPQARAKQRGAA